MLQDFLDLLERCKTQKMIINYNLGPKRNWTGSFELDEVRGCFTIRTDNNRHPVLGNAVEESPWSKINTVVWDGKYHIMTHREATELGLAA